MRRVLKAGSKGSLPSSVAKRIAASELPVETDIMPDNSNFHQAVLKGELGERIEHDS